MRKRIGIVGGGASGVLVALQCWKKHGAEAEILVFDPAPRLGRGKAYETQDTENILNVPAANMSAFPDRADDFVQWVTRLEPHIRDSKHWPYVPRKYFGQYLEEKIAEIPRESFRHVRSKVASVTSGYRAYQIKLEDRTAHEVDYLVVATGYGRDHSPKYRSNVTRLSKNIVQAAAVEGSSNQISGHVLIVGSGLTALDIWKRLRKDPRIRFTFLSRRGIFPESHESTAGDKVAVPVLSGMSPLQIFQILRCLKQSRQASWAAVADQVRAQAQKIWSCWTDKEKARFVRHVKPYWEIIRHRVPKAVADDLRSDLASGRVHIVSGRVHELNETGDALITVAHSPRVASSITLSSDWIVLATGSSIHQDLFRDQPVPGIRRCSHGFGYINESAPRVWIAGPPSKSVFWEITAVPDIRGQALSIATAIAEDQRPNSPLRVRRISTHPDLVGESYLAHLKASASFGLKMWRLGWYAMVHALLPFLHLDTTSAHLRNLSPVLSRRRQRVSALRANTRLKPSPGSG